MALIPEGRVASYGQIAAILGNPRAARTVGWALHSLPNGTDVPWHRVINAGGFISTDCGEHDPGLQRGLLQQEGIRFDSRGRIDFDVCGWHPSLDEIDRKLKKSG